MNIEDTSDLLDKDKIVRLLKQITNKSITVDDDLDHVETVINKLETQYNITKTLTNQIKKLKSYSPLFLTILYRLLIKLLYNGIDEPSIFDHLDIDGEYTIHLEWEYYSNNEIKDYITVVILETHIDIIIPSQSNSPLEDLTLKYKNIIYKN